MSLQMTFRKFIVLLSVFSVLGSLLMASAAVLAPSQVPSAAVLGRYVLWNDKFWMVTNKTVQQLSSEGYNVLGEPNQLVNVNYTRLNYTMKNKIVKLNWPNITAEIVEGGHDLNVTVYKIEGGAIGERIGSFLRPNQPSRAGRTYDTWDPAFGPGFSPSVLWNGNTVTSWFEYHVTGPEILQGTPWGQNQTFVLTGEKTNSTHSFRNCVWCDAGTGIVLKQIYDQKTPNLVTHEEMFISETGIEEVKQGLSDQLPIIIASVIIVIAAIGIIIYFLKFRRKKAQQK